MQPTSGAEQKTRGQTSCGRYEQVVEKSCLNRRWNLFRPDAALCTSLGQTLGVDPVLATLLCARGAGNHAEAASLLSPRLRETMPHPFCLQGVEAACDLLFDAVRTQRRIVLWGDYDVDGVCATAMMVDYLRQSGASPIALLPSRFTTGYGLSSGAVQQILAHAPDVVIALDCGSNDTESIARLQAAGARVIVIDHHQIASAALPPAATIVNPFRADDMSGLKDLSATGLTFMVLAGMHVMWKQRAQEASRPDLFAFLDRCALGLVCDVMPLTGLTRVLVHRGLRVLECSANPGLRALCAAQGQPFRAESDYLAFALGPCINAAGRLHDPALALDLLTTGDDKRALALANELMALNMQRKALEKQAFDQARRRYEKTVASEEDAAHGVILADSAWAEGIIGIVAARLRDAFTLPAVVFSIKDEEAVGSARSLPAVDIGAIVRKAVEAGFLISGGGHAAAAGMRCTTSKLPAFRAWMLDQLARAPDDMRESSESIDASLGLGAVCGSFLDNQNRLAPFGKGFAAPSYMWPRARVLDSRLYRGGHLALRLGDDSGSQARGIAFRAEATGLVQLRDLASYPYICLSGHLAPDSYRGPDKAQIHIRDVAAC